MSAAAAPAVREATTGDAAALARLLAQLGYPAHPAQVGGRLLTLSRDGLTRVLVAESGGGVCGFLALTRLDVLPYAAPVARITAMCVDEASRGAGVGRALERQAAAVARCWGCEKLEVTSNRRRVRAHGFYLQNGYEETHRCFVKGLPKAEPGGGEDGPR